MQSKRRETLTRVACIARRQEPVELRGLIVFWSLVVLSGLALLGPAAVRGEERPNIVLLLTDPFDTAPPAHRQDRGRPRARRPCRTRR